MAQQADTLFAVEFLEQAAALAEDRPRELSALQADLVACGIVPEHLTLDEIAAAEQHAVQAALALLAEGA